MRLRFTSRVWRLVATFAPIPLVAIGYLAVEPGSEAAFRLEVLLSGKGSAHARPLLRGALDSEPLALSPEALHLFDVPTKGPRADLYLTLLAEEAPPAAKQAIANGTPVDANVTAALPTTTSVMEIIRSSKSDRLAPVVALAKATALPSAPVAEPLVENVSAALFLATSENPLAFVTPAVASTSGASPDPSNVKLAAYSPSDEALKLKYHGESEAEFQERERRCLATAIYFEARGEPIKGQQAVAQVIMNRVRSPLFPDTVCGVVYQGQFQKAGCQFSFACDGIADVPRDATQWAVAVRLAKQVTEGKIWLPEIGYSSHYHATYVRPDWIPMMSRITQISRHIFYKYRNDKPYVVEQAAAPVNDPAGPAATLTGFGDASPNPVPSLAFGPSG